MERGTGIEPVSLAWKARAQPLYQPRIKYIMHTYDTFTKNGIHVHLSVSNYNTCYIFVNDIYDNRLTMRYFTDMNSAIAFINTF